MSAVRVHDDLVQAELICNAHDVISHLVLHFGVHVCVLLLRLLNGDSDADQELAELLLARLLGKPHLCDHIVRVLNRVEQCPVSEKHQFQLRFGSNMADFTVFCLQVEGEEVFGSVLVSLVDDIVLSGGLFGHKELDFLHAAHVLAIFILHVDLLMENLVSQADYSPPENLSGHLIQLLAQLVENG